MKKKLVWDKTGERLYECQPGRPLPDSDRWRI